MSRQFSRSLIILLITWGQVSADIFTSSVYPGSSGIVSHMPVPTKHTLIFIVMITVIFYSGVNLFRRYYLERYDRGDDGKLYPVECQPENSLLNGLFSLSARWGIVRPPMTKCTQQHMFAGWGQAFTQCGHYWKKLGDGMVTITYYPERDKYRLVMKTSTEVVLVNHELTKYMALFKDENQGIYISRWSAVDFASRQPRSETFCVRWNNLGVAESFNQNFYKCTQPACYTDNDLFPLTRDKNQIPGFCKQMDFQTQWPTSANQQVQVCDPHMPGGQPHAPCPAVPCTRFPGEPLYDIFTGDRRGACDRAGSSGSQAGRSGPPSEQSSNFREPNVTQRKGPRRGPQATPSQLKPQPSRMAAQPSRMGPQPSRMGPQASRMSAKKSKMGPQPSRMGPQPSRMGPQPSRMGPQPSRMGPQPSRMGPQPSRMGPQPSSMGAKKSRLAPPKSAMKQT